ncbi:hypothetical protein J2Z31_003654 [Sinorhizobium kostiense]|uniref:Uncharacterized protein n=1 Tax=Sinorhizobium kostiense TaxID=76747 RepID=A0ABS4R2N2_9HYPH|nr:hypothetical protein [Sinorhizobium kostiense]MBP2237140.1 hypothetical protein [Sinorhizobium kostiense]
MAAWLKMIGGALALAALAWAVLEIREDGAQSARQAIERQNNEAALQSAARRSDFDRCVDRGGVWDFGTGKCRRPPPGGRD